VTISITVVFQLSEKSQFQLRFSVNQIFSFQIHTGMSISCYQN